jgi:hypothetical protein
MQVLSAACAHPGGRKSFILSAILGTRQQMYPQKSPATAASVHLAVQVRAEEAVRQTDVVLGACYPASVLSLLEGGG